MANMLENNNVKIFAVCSILAVVIWSAFSFILNNDVFAVDDFGYVFNNPMVKQGLTIDSLKYAFTSVEQCNWHPLTWISHMLDISMFGANPRAHHAVSIVLHIVNGLLCFFLFYRITQNMASAFLIALFFAVHPLRVESVAWIAERKDILSVLFAFLSLICYLTYGTKKSAVYYLLCLACLLLSLLSKAMFVTMPFLFLLLDYWPLKRMDSADSGKSTKWPLLSLIIEKIPFFCAIAAFSVIAYIAQSQAGATFLGSSYPLHLRLENAAISYVRYIAKIIFPWKLAVFYPIVFSHATIWLSAGSFLLLIAVTGAFLKLRKTMPWLIVGWLWFLGTLIPVIGLVQIGHQAMADRYTYFPSLGILLILVVTGSRWAAKKMIFKYALVTLACAAVLCFFTKTFIQTTYWKNSLTLFEYTLRATGQNPAIQLLYAGQLERAQEYEEALKQYLDVHKQVPDQALPLVCLSRVCHKQQRIEQALEYARKACETSAYQDPAVLKHMAQVLYAADKKKDAMDYLNRSLQLTDPHKKPELYKEVKTLYDQISQELKDK